jgi:hypothetical protein
MTIRDVLAVATRLVGASTLAAGVFWQVAEHAGRRECVAYVHVMEPRVDVTIDDEAYRIEGFESAPIVSQLRPGRHTLKMSRRGQILYKEEFSLRAGEEIVLTAWQKERAERTRAYNPVSVPESLTGL